MMFYECDRCGKAREAGFHEVGIAPLQKRGRDLSRCAANERCEMKANIS